MFQLNIPFEQRMKCLEETEELPEHVELRKRLKKTLYYGKMTDMDRPSLAVTEMTVEFLLEMAPKELGKIDMYWASAVSRDVSVSPCALMLALIYIKRLKHANSQYLSQVSSSDLFLISMLVASKFLYDEGGDEEVSNTQWAHLTNMDVDDINETERSFLSALDWNVFVSSHDFWDALLAMERKVAWRMGLRRNSFTYTDLVTITSEELLCRSFKGVLVEVCKVAAICCIAYSACATTMVLSHLTSVFILSQTLPLLSLPIDSPLAVIPSVSPSTVKNKSYNSLPLATHNCPLSPNSCNGDFLSCFDFLQACTPWNSTWNPRTCFHVTTCMTIALMKELVMSTNGFLSNALLALSTQFVGHSSSNMISVSQFLPRTENRSKTICCCRHANCGENSKGLIYISTSSPAKESSVCTRKEKPRAYNQFHDKISEGLNTLSDLKKPCLQHEKPLFQNVESNICCDVTNKISLQLNYSMMLPSLPPRNQIPGVFG